MAAVMTIGEVLSLLQDDFSDITISKIRFLEGQGLVNPERSPSGYRKFRDSDVQCLRWILTQQRDHFLPLKVIKERLAAGELDDLEPSQLQFDVSQERKTQTTEATDSTIEVAAVNVSSDRQERALMVAALVEAPPEAVVSAASSVAKPAKPSSPKERVRHPTIHTKGDPTPISDGVVIDPIDAVGLALSLEDLCHQSGLTPAQVDELERYGLIDSSRVGRLPFYDENALVVARLAAGFARYGVEARHLRMYRMAAEREASLFEQLIAPLLKQRKASAREQAVEMLDELAELSDDLRAAMVRSALQEFLGRA